MRFCRRLHKTGKPWYKWMTRRELRELREVHRGKQKSASPPQSPNGDKDGAKEEESLATVTPAHKDVPEIVVSNGHVVPDIGQSESDENNLVHYHHYYLYSSRSGHERDPRREKEGGDERGHGNGKRSVRERRH